MLRRLRVPSLVTSILLTGLALPALASAQLSPAGGVSVLPRTTTSVLLVIPASAGADSAAANVSLVRRAHLARALRYAGATVVFATDTRPVAILGQVLADSVLHIERVPYDRGTAQPDKYAGWLIANLMLGQEGRTVVLVAERPLASALVRRATGIQIDATTPSERDELMILTIAPSHSALVRTGM